MVTFEFIQLFYKRKIRWFIICCIIFVASLFVPSISDMYAPLNILDFLASALTQQFLSVVIIPILFLFLVGDLITGDLNDGWISMTFQRARSRISWLFAKVTALFASAFLFTVICFVIYTISGAILGMAFEGGWSHHSIFSNQFPPFTVLAVIGINYVFTLTAFGTFILLLSLLTLNTMASWSTGALLSFFSYITWMNHEFHPFLKWMPAGQMMFLAQFPNKLTVNLNEFTLQWSYTYNAVLFILSFMACILVMRQKDMSK